MSIFLNILMAYVQQVRFGCPNSNLTFFLMSMRLELLLHPGKKLTSYIECKHISCVYYPQISWMVLCQSGCGETTYQLYTHTPSKTTSHPACVCQLTCSLQFFSVPVWHLIIIHCLPQVSWIFTQAHIFSHKSLRSHCSIFNQAYPYCFMKVSRSNIAMMFPQGRLTGFSLLTMVKKIQLWKIKTFFELLCR